MDEQPAHPDDHAAVRRSLFDRPLLWLALVAVGVILAVALSFLAERTNLNGPVGDVGHFCQEVPVVTRISAPTASANATAGIGEIDQLVGELRSLEEVAPDPVRDDVIEVRQSAETLQAALASMGTGDPGSVSPAASTSAVVAALRDAATRSEGAITRMTEYTQEACGIDLGSPTLPPPVFPTTTTR